MDSDPLFDRLRRALEPDYRLERLIGSGGMGMVYLATDLTLHSPVAVKLLRPELDTAHGAEAFMREAQLMARVRHPNVVTIYHAQANNGLHYYIMEFVNGPTLQERLERGPLSRHDALRMGRDLLDGLESVHHESIVHRDIKPSNVFVIGDRLRAKLSDFGIARAPTLPQRVGNERRSVIQEGTAGYQAPEQMSGGPITHATDLYQAGLVIYEALTNERYLAGPVPSWRGIPGSIAGVLRRALQDDPIKRWPDAREFRHALWRTRVLQYLVRAAMLAIGGIIVGATAVIIAALIPFSCSAPGTLRVAVPPFEYIGPPAHAAIADSLARQLRVELRSHPEFRVTTTRWAFVRWPFRAPALRIQGRVAVVGEDIDVQLADVRLRGSGTPLSDVRAPLAAWATLPDSLTYRVLLAVWDSLSPLRGSLPRNALPRTPIGLSQFLYAEQLVAAGRWENAYMAYLSAESDSSCLLCSWRLNEVERWLALQHDTARVQRLLNHISAFPAWYQSLIRAAQLPLPQRLDTLRAETKRWRDFFLGYLQLGDEMFHRGPLDGHSRAEAIPALEQAARLRPDFAPSSEHLAWVDIAEGDSAGAARALQVLDRRNVGNDPFAIALRALLGVAFAFRFLPETSATDSLRHALGDSVVRASANLSAGPRMLGAFDVPRGEIVFGELFAASPERELARSGLIAQIFGSVATGKHTAALALAQRLGAISPEREISRFRVDLDATLSQLERASVAPESPFYRTVTRLRLADQAVQRGDVEGARRQLLWHEHTDIIGLPTGLPQAAEIDWAFGTEARWRLGSLLATSNRVEACHAYRDVVRLWSDGEPLYRARADTARQRLIEMHCGS